MGNCCSKSPERIVSPSTDADIQPATSVSKSQLLAADAQPTETAPAALPKIVFVLGGPGSGKGTLCSLIVKDYGFKHLSAGDLLRDEINSRPDSELSLAITEHMKQGTLVPPSVIVPLLRNAIKACDVSTPGFLIDGFPREVSQAEEFEAQVGKPTHVLFIDCPLETMKTRLMSRGLTSGRVDDNEETILLRFATFQSQSMLVVEHYKALGIVSQIEGGEVVEVGYAQVQAAMNTIV